MWVIFRRYLLFTVVFVVAPLALFAQRGPGILWQKPYGGRWLDWGMAFDKTTDGGYILAGHTSSDEIPRYHPDLNTLNQRFIDSYIIKIDSLGVIQWEKAYGGDSTDGAKDIIQTNDGGYAVIGQTDSPNGDVTGHKSRADIWMLKLNASGNIEWQKTFGGDSTDFGLSILQTPDGGYLIAGSTQSGTGDVTFHRGLGDVWIIKTNASGSIQWQKTYGGTQGDGLEDIILTRDSNYVFLGATNSNNGDVSGLHGLLDLWIVKIDKNGTLLWQKTLGGSNNEFPKQITETLDGGFAVVGLTLSSDGDVTNHHGEVDTWVVKLNSAGTLQWQRAYGGSSRDGDYYWPVHIIQKQDSTYMIASCSYSTDGDLSGLFRQGDMDFWLFQIGKTGNLMWGQRYGGTSVEDGACLLELSDGYSLFGTTRSNDQDISGIHRDTITPGAGIYDDAWFVRLCTWTGYQLSGDTLDFDDVPLCTYRDTVIELFNTGCYNYFIDSTKFTGQHFELLKRPQNILKMGGVDTFRVRYHSERHGKSSASITFYYQEHLTKKSITIPIRANGSAGMVELVSSPDSLTYDFPPTSICSSKDTQYITLKNLGCDTIKLLNIAYMNDGPTLVGSRIGPAKARLFDMDTLLFRWLITPSTEGIFQAKIILTLGFPDGTTRDTILTANAVVLPGSAQLSNSLNKYIFSSRPACTRIDSVRFTIRNLGCDTLNIVHVAFSNDGTTLMGNGPTSGSLIGNQELKYRWLLDPQQPGNYQASVTITYKLPDGSTRDTTFRASAAVAPGAPVFSSSLSSDSYTFPSRSLCAANDTVLVTIRNGGCDTLYIVKVIFDNINALTGTLSYWDSTLGPTDSTVLTWIFDPETQGTYTADMIITYKLSDGTERDTVITATATVLPGDALFVSSLANPIYTFSARPACGGTDSATFAIKNPGCDTLSIVNIVFANAIGILEGSQLGTGLTGLIADDSIVFRWLVSATSPGTYRASIAITYKLPDGSEHDTTFLASIAITPGNKSLMQPTAAIAYGPTYLCEERDTTLNFVNDGCDTLTIYDIRLVGNGFTIIQPAVLPIVVKPSDTIEVIIRTIAGDTTGHPLTFTDTLEIMSTADDGTALVPFSRQLTYPSQFGLNLSEPVSAGNLQTATYSLSLTGTPPQAVTALQFDVTYHRDLLELIDFTTGNINFAMTSSTYQGELATTGFTLSPVPGPSIIAELRFMAYLSKTDTTLIKIENVRFDVRSNVPGNCIASVEKGISVFRYDDACGEPTIRSFMQGNTPFEVIALRPQPYTVDASKLYLDLVMRQSGKITVSSRNILGAAEEILFANTLQTGRHSLALDLSDVREGVYFLTIECGGRSVLKKVIVH